MKNLTANLSQLLNVSFLIRFPRCSRFSPKIFLFSAHKSNFRSGSLAFTLIETLLAITMVMVVLTSVTGLILMTLLANSMNQHQLQATYLAQEGVEVLRYMRDSNWLQNYDWDGGDWGTSFEAGATGKNVYIQTTGCGLVSHQRPCFQLTTDPTVGTITLDDGMTFERRIELLAVGSSSGSPSPDETEVTAVVTWDEHGQTQSVEVSTFLTNWK